MTHLDRRTRIRTRRSRGFVAVAEEASEAVALRSELETPDDRTGAGTFPHSAAAALVETRSEPYTTASGVATVQLVAVSGNCVTGVTRARLTSRIVLDTVTQLYPTQCFLSGEVTFSQPLSDSSASFNATGIGGFACFGLMELDTGRLEVTIQGASVSGLGATGVKCQSLVGGQIRAIGEHAWVSEVHGRWTPTDDLRGVAMGAVTTVTPLGHTPWRGAGYFFLAPTRGNCMTGVQSATFSGASVVTNQPITASQ